MAKKITTEEIIERFRKVHGDKYDYSKFEYVNATTKGIIICPKHGEFMQSSNVHEKGINCPLCARENIKRCAHKMTKEIFLERAREKHGNKYEYDLTNFNGQKNKIRIKCPIHGWFEQSVPNHLTGQGCKHCGNEEKREKMGITLEEFIERAHARHNHKFDYSKVSFINNKSVITIICPIHGEFQQRMDEHLKGKGCAKCVGRNKTHDDFVAEARAIHGDKYDYLVDTYRTAESKIKIKCNKCGGIFEQKPWSHLQGHGCPKCKFSRGEVEIEQMLIVNGINYEFQKRFDWLGNQSLDFFIPLINVAIEIQGSHHFDGSRCFGHPELFNITVERDERKLKLCIENGINVLYFTNINVNIDGYLGPLYKDKNVLLADIKQMFIN